MLNGLFQGIFDSQNEQVISLQSFLLVIGISILIGLMIAIFYVLRNKTTHSFFITLAILPSIVSVVIMMVNGNIGAGVAVAGAFTLVRFRSAQGRGKEIAILFLAMASGLLCGMGYLAYGVLFTLIICLIMFGVSFIPLKQTLNRLLKVVVPEDLNYTDSFEDLFKEFTNGHELIQTKTVNLGSLFHLTYEITMLPGKTEKEFIDAIRCRNGNLEVNIATYDGDNSLL